MYVSIPTRPNGIGLAWDPQNPSFGFTIVCPVVVLREEINDDDIEVLQFQVYSSKTGEWRVSENVSDFRVPSLDFLPRRFLGVYAGKKRVYWSLIDHIMWFDIEKDVAGLINIPHHCNFVHPNMNLTNTEIGICNGEVSYSRMTKRGDLEIWLLREKDDDKFEWLKKQTIGLQLAKNS
ncbi:hypothetical protein Scep_019016 [Stephania cephalantha]|uniref:F-box protein At3g26010-like beta-propeller domain-containing protein n=1 Tax=Stephania cephalantha TaxID=152367 RepID=A0AAP0IA71_9MAGN